MLTVRLLGAPHIQLDDQPLDALRRKSRALVFFLAAQPQPVSRDRILALFWPDHDRAAAQQTLRTTLHEMRKLLGDALATQGDSLSLASDAHVDARALESVVTDRAGDIARLTHALAMYRGDFLDGFTLADTPSFDDWAAAERERYRLLAVRGFASLARLHEANHDSAAALDAVTSALKLDPLQEDLHGAAMRLRYLTGDRAGAVRQYEALRRLLDDELGVAPMPETRALYDDIITDRLPIPSPRGRGDGRESIASSASAPFDPQPIAATDYGEATQTFVGRAREFDLLQSAVDAGKLALIEGEPGIGKTRLAEEFLRKRSARVLIVRGTAHELEQNLPYQPVIEALRGLAAQADWPAMRAALGLAPMWLNEAARIAPELVAEPEDIPALPPNESQLWESVLRVLHALSQRQRVIVFLDDLHWADGATLGLIGYLARRNVSPTLTLLCTARTAHPRSKLAVLTQSLAREGQLARIVPTPLSTQEVSALAAEYGRAHAGWLAHWLADKSEGNPFFAAELLRFAKDNRWLEEEAPQPAALSATVPETISDLIASRITHLSEPARRALDIAAVIGREFTFDLIAQVSQSDEISVLDACDELRAAALVQPSHDDSFRFDHSLTLDVALREMGAARNRALHRRTAEALERVQGTRDDAGAGAGAGAIAQHYLAGNSPERAAPFALRAGKFAVGVAAWSEAIAFFEQALSAGVSELRVAALLGLAESHWHNGDFQNATRAVQTALAATQSSAVDAATIEAIYELLMLTHIPPGRYGEVIAYGEVLRRDGPPELALCAEYVIGAGLNVEGKRPAEAERHLLEAERLLAQPRNFKSSVTLAKLRFQRANVLGQQGRTGDAAAMSKDVLDMVRQDESALDLQIHILVYNQLAHYLHILGDPAAVEYVQLGLNMAQEKGTLTHKSYLLSTSGEIALARGDLDAAERFFSEGLALAEQLSVHERIAGLTANLGLVARQRGLNVDWWGWRASD